MSTVRPVGAAVVGPIVVFAAMLAGASAAHAAPYIDDASISVSVGSPCVGEVEIINGSGFAPGERVVIELRSEPIELGTVTADPDGDFTLRVRVPDAVDGDHVVAARGVSSGASATTEIDIRDCDDGNDGDDDSDGSSDDGGFTLPRTGATVGGLGVAGLVLIGTGIAVRRSRRRNAEG